MNSGDNLSFKNAEIFLYLSSWQGASVEPPPPDWLKEAAENVPVVRVYGANATSAQAAEGDDAQWIGGAGGVGAFGGLGGGFRGAAAAAAVAAAATTKPAEENEDWEDDWKTNDAKTLS